LTFTATSPFLKSVAEAHGLVQLDSATAQGEEHRQLWVTEDARALMHGESDEYFPVERFARVIELYLLGYLMRMSLLGDPNENLPDLELMHTVDQVWLLCCRKPKGTQYRFFGRFTAQGEFVVLFGRPRKSLGKGGYATAVQQFLTQWEAMFGGNICHTAGTCEDYCGGVVSDVDDQDEPGEDQEAEA